MIFPEIEKRFTLKEILDLNKISEQGLIQSYIHSLEQQNLELVLKFIKSFQRRVLKIYEEYEATGRKDFVSNLIFEKQKDIHLK